MKDDAKRFGLRSWKNGLPLVKTGMTGVGGGMGRGSSVGASWCGWEPRASVQNRKHTGGWWMDEQLVLEH